MVLTEEVHSDLIRGFKDFYVIGAFASEPETIHSRSPLTSLPSFVASACA